MQTATHENSTCACAACADPAHVLGTQIEDTYADILAADDEGDVDAAGDHRDRLEGLRLALAFTSATSHMGRLAHAREAQRLCSTLVLRLEAQIDAMNGMENELVKPLTFTLQRICDAAAAEAA